MFDIKFKVTYNDHTKTYFCYIKKWFFLKWRQIGMSLGYATEEDAMQRIKKYAAYYYQKETLQRSGKIVKN